MFDGHVATLLEATVSLVNVLTDGAARGRPYTAPRAGLLPAAVDAALPSSGSGPRTVTAEEAEHLVRTAESMRQVFEAVHAERTGEAAAVVNALLLSTGARPQLDQVPGEPWQVHFHGPDDTLAVGWSAGCAAALALAIGSDLGGRLGVCQAAACDRVYVDSSRNGVRHFCSSACRSRVKAATHRERRQARAGGRTTAEPA
ncbi:CGNR zinc finger domain-containing protein [Nonomuraea sp. SMC257]|uniref:CGNR zinc finger domain-containing protein n=1 Tax=Nonomuraea montanisoli TaxID=2741721 RepID=A0A7Y6M7V2_9ACTN|nr:CGNR zinc finger domain-containing protein [Nonomuraea montanisoli]NUW38433.1 CGNR zinc finger domain-containing protein [Nonomuraea montanisoli]